MKPMWAIAKLTWKAAFRFRLFWVLLALLTVSVVVLPVLIRDDGTARGFIQILLTYNLGIIATLLGFSTLWLSCGSLSRDIEDCQLQVVAVKPIPRWQIWAGKWIGIMLLNTVLLMGAGKSVYYLLKWRAQKLPQAQQQILEDEVFVARASLREKEQDLEAQAEVIFKQRLQQQPVPAEDHQMVRDMIRNQLQSRFEVVPPGYIRAWTIDLGLRRHLLTDQPMFLRFKFHSAMTNATGTFMGSWEVGPPNSESVGSYPMSLAANAFHEMPIPANLYDEQGVLTVRFLNRSDAALVFPMDDGFEVLYREGGFYLNYIRGLWVILSWMGLLTAMGLFAGSFLSFPVAAFFCLSLLTVVLSSGTMAGALEEGTVLGVNHETGEGGVGFLDTVLLSVYDVVLDVIGLVQQYSPIDSLSTGRSITWGQLALAWVKTVVVLGGFFAACGMMVLTRRELALPQGSN